MNSPNREANRLQSQLQRLYLPMVDKAENVRAMVIELARPADWETLAKAWRGAQDDLELPAPGIAVSGIDGFQLWFSLEQPIAVDLARAFLQGLCARYLADVAANRLRLTPSAATASTLQAQEAPMVPALQRRTGYWSAFVTADLAPIFDGTPWVESAPSDDGQAGVLSHLHSITRPVFDAALERLGVAISPPDVPEPTTPSETVDHAPVRSGDLNEQLSPRQFLLQVMNDERVALVLRVEAAKALLPYHDR